MSCDPPTALSTAVSVVRRRTSEMPDRAVTVVQVLATQVDYFERLVLDLLEISSLDVGAERVRSNPSTCSASCGGCRASWRGRLRRSTLPDRGPSRSTAGELSGSWATSMKTPTAMPKA